MLFLPILMLVLEIINDMIYIYRFSLEIIFIAATIW